MKNKNLIIYIVICLIIIAGIAVWNAKGFHSELQYSSRYEIQLSNYTGIEISDIQEIASEVLGNTKYTIQRVETFGNSVVIVSEAMSEEQKNQIVEKFNQKYQTELKAEEIKIVAIPFTRIKDVIKPFLAPGIATLLLITLYFLIRYRKLGIKKVLLTTLALPVVAELLIFSFMAIVRIPFGRLAVALGASIYFVIILILTNIFENKRNAYIANLENNNDLRKE